LREGAWLDPLRQELDSAAAPRTFYFRDDDGGWASGRLLSVLDLFASYGVPLDVAVIPAAVDRALARKLRTRREHEEGALAFHQHGYTHENHERNGRPCEFGPGRSKRAQRHDIAAGAHRLRNLLGSTAAIFTPPWNRCTETTGRCLVELGFRVLVRDSSAVALGLDGLRELELHVDWSARRKGRCLGRSEVGALLAAASRCGPTGVMLHHALVGREGLAELEQFLALLSAHDNACCVPLRSLA